MHMWSPITRQNGSLDIDEQMQTEQKDQITQGTKVIHVCIWGLNTKQNGSMD